MRSWLTRALAMLLVLSIPAAADGQRRKRAKPETEGSQDDKSPWKASTRLEAIKEVLMRSTVADASLGETARALARRLADLELRLDGDERRDDLGGPGPVSISRRLGVAFMGTNWSTYGPTPTHRRSFEIAAAGFTSLAADLEGLLETDLPALEESLDAAGVPWTPGRGVPDAGE